MRLDGAGRSARPKTLTGTNAGSASVAPAAARKRRRLKAEFAGELFISRSKVKSFALEVNGKQFVQGLLTGDFIYATGPGRYDVAGNEFIGNRSAHFVIAPGDFGAEQPGVMICPFSEFVLGAAIVHRL